VTSTEPAAASSTRADELLLELFLTHEGHQDPHSRYRELHRIAPVHVSGTGDVVLCRYDDCRALLRDDRFGKNLQPRGVPGAEDSAAMEFRRQRAEELADAPVSMLLLNPPDHTRIRGLVNRAFTPRRVEGLRDHITALAEECFDDMAEAGDIDLLDALAFPLPVAVIGELVGVPRADWPRFRELMRTATLTLESGATVKELEEADRSGKEAWQYFVDLVAHKRQHPGDDLVTAMIEVSDSDGDRLTEGELIAQANVMFAAGFETTTNLIGNGVVALLRHPDQLALLRERPDLVSSAVEEMLRFDSPVQLDARSALEAAEVQGIACQEGQRVITLLGAANRDPVHWTEPDRFDVTRAEGPPMSFASGIHYCLGANLARAEGQVVVTGLLRRFRSLELTGELVNRQRLTLRGYEAIPMRVVPA
jgi:cytochrome P450